VQGLCAHLEAVLGAEELRRRGVVVGFDHRATPSGAITSRRFAYLTAQAFLLRSVPVRLYGELSCTPLVPFGVDHFGAAAGVMVTASHNPKEDDGYKVYWSNGCQIVPPVDAGIAAAIEANLAPWDARAYADATEASVRGHALCSDGLPEALEAYVAAATRKLRRVDAALKAAAPRVVYTAMHGVGKRFVERMFAAFDLQAPVLVPAQVEPDPAFPTVRFPNPEEGAGALQLAFEAADAAGASLILANDPDADRLAVAEKDRRSGRWTVFTGNEIGVLFADWEWRQWQRTHGTGDGGGAGGDGGASAGGAGGAEIPEKATTPATSTTLEATRPVMLATTVSSKMLKAMARAEGFAFEETLTGFKWLGSRSDELRRAGAPVIFSYEEAIGFCVGDVVKDKDGVVGAAVFAEMHATLATEGRTAVEHLEALRAKYGVFRQRNGYVFSPDPRVTQGIFDAFIRGGEYAPRLGPFAIDSLRDLQHAGFDSAFPDRKPRLPTSSAPMLTFSLANGASVTLRASGTEPKLKYYIECVAASDADALALCDQVFDAVMADFIQPHKHGIDVPGWAPKH
jgi:phosphomannomutase